MSYIVNLLSVSKGDDTVVGQKTGLCEFMLFGAPRIWCSKERQGPEGNGKSPPSGEGSYKQPPSGEGSYKQPPSGEGSYTQLPSGEDSYAQQSSAKGSFT